MPYYHVYIFDRDTHKKEFDFLKKQLMKYIIEPYSLGKKFMFGGSLVAPSNIRTIRIIETEQPSSELLDKIKAERGVLKRLVLDGDAFRLVERIGRDVTREVLFGEKQRQRKKTPIPLSKNVFIVHGRDHKPMKELKTMLSEFGLNPIVLHEQPSGSRTVVEKLEKYSDVGYSFVILTPDDVGALYSKFVKLRPERLIKRSLRSILDLKPRARQNVVLEFGYFMGLLGRNRVCCLHKGSIKLPLAKRVELPSDMHGIVYVPFKDSVEEVRDMIIKELKEAGYEIKV